MSTTEVFVNKGDVYRVLSFPSWCLYRSQGSSESLLENPGRLTRSDLSDPQKETNSDRPLTSVDGGWKSLPIQGLTHNFYRDSLEFRFTFLIKFNWKPLECPPPKEGARPILLSLCPVEDVTRETYLLYESICHPFHCSLRINSGTGRGVSWVVPLNPYTWTHRDLS